MKIVQHLSAMAIITIIMGLICASVQQTYRFNANDPHLQEKISGMTKMIVVCWVLCISVVLINWLVTFYYYKRNRLAHETK